MTSLVNASLSMTSDDEKAIKETVDFKGNLYKKGKINKSWKDRYFVLCKELRKLTYYEDDVEKGMIDLRTISRIEVLCSSDSRFRKELPSMIAANGEAKSDKMCAFQLVAEDRTYVMAAPSKPVLFQWLNHIRSAVHGDILKEGYLRKQGQVNKSWKQRYFILNNFRELRYFDNERTCLGVIDVSSIQQDLCHGKENGKGHKFTFKMATPSRTWVISCKTDAERVQ